MTTFIATTKVENGNLVLRLSNNDNTILLTLKDNDSRSIDLEAGKYWLEWWFWNNQNATYTVDVTTTPSVSPLPVNHTYNYNGPHDDEKVPFSFNI